MERSRLRRFFWLLGVETTGRHFSLQLDAINQTSPAARGVCLALGCHSTAPWLSRSRGRGDNYRALCVAFCSSCKLHMGRLTFLCLIHARLDLKKVTTFFVYTDTTQWRQVGSVRVTRVAACSLISLEFSGQLHVFDSLPTVAFGDGSGLDG